MSERSITISTKKVQSKSEKQRRSIISQDIPRHRFQESNVRVPAPLGPVKQPRGAEKCYVLCKSNDRVKEGEKVPDVGWDDLQAPHILGGHHHVIQSGSENRTSQKYDKQASV